ncbi:MAG: hypothetical protein ABI675_29760 [Chitinophagaceae bacterium]
MKNNTVKKNATILCLAFVMITFCIGEIKAQNPILREAIKISKAYRGSSYLSFDVKYSYAKESTPTVIEDSSFVHYKMNGYKYQGSMDSVVFMQNDSVKVAVYLQDQIMTLGLPSYEQEMAMPLAQWDSFFVKNNFTYSTGVDAGYKKITVDYTNLSQNPLKKFEMWYDSVTYRINRIKYKIDEAASNETWVEEGVLSGNVMIMDVQFSNYQTGTFTSSVFNPANYFTKSGTVYTPVSPYTGYEVYVTTPGL